MKIPWKKPGRLDVSTSLPSPRHGPGRDCAFETAPFGGAVSLLHAGAAATCARGDEDFGLRLVVRDSATVGGTKWWFPI